MAIDIARSKAGIIKRGIPYMTGERRSECLDISSMKKPISIILML